LVFFPFFFFFGPETPPPNPQPGRLRYPVHAQEDRLARN
jgi:hypothetical protein